MTALETLIANYILWLAIHPYFLIIVWAVYLLLQRVWGGLANFMSIILFPGHIIKRTEQVGLAYLFRGKIRPVGWFAVLSHRRFAFLYVILPRHPLHGTLIALIPILINYLLVYILSNLLVYVRDPILALLFAWFLISLIITGFPDKTDLAIVFNTFIATDPTLVFYYVWIIMIFALFYIGYGLPIAIFVSLSYFLIITLTTAYFIQKEPSEDIVLDEEEM